MRALLLSLVVVLAVSLVPLPVLGQGHVHAEGGAMILIMSDVPADGRAVVGGITHFAYVLLDEDGAPLPHHDVYVQVTLNGIVLYETKSAHDYDGVGSLDIVFPVTGQYQVRVAAPYEGTELASVYEGYVVEPPQATANVEVDLPVDPAARALTPFTIRIVDANGTIVPHTDALIEIRRLADDFPVLAFHAHIHGDPIFFEYSFEEAGRYGVRVVAYTAFPSEDDVVFPVAVFQGMVVVREGVPAGAPGLPPLPGTVASDAAVESNAPTDLLNFLVADPATGTDMQVGPFGQVRASLVTYNTTTMALVQHLNYEAQLDGPRGTVFRSTSLHEYDGVFEAMSADQGLGMYTWTMTVKGDGWSDTRMLAYEVRPVVLPLGVGPQFIDARYDAAALVSGAPQAFELYAHGLAPQAPFMHSEVAVEVRNALGVPLLAHKLHTHADGLFAFAFVFPDEGDYTLQRDLFDIHGSPTPSYHGESLTTSKTLDLSVALGRSLPVPPVQEMTVTDTGFVPAPGLVVLLVTLALLAFAVRRR